MRVPPEPLGGVPGWALPELAALLVALQGVLAALRALHLDRSHAGDRVSMYEGQVITRLNVAKVSIPDVG